MTTNTPPAPAKAAPNGKPKPAPKPPASPAAQVVQSDIDIDIDERTLEQGIPTFPLAQWLNGDSKLAKLGGVAYTGGLVIPFIVKRGKRTVENIPADFDLPGFTLTAVEFDSGNE